MPEFLVKDLMVQLTKVTNLFLNPKMETKCTNIQIIQATNPLRWNLPMSTTALLRPTVAIDPLSKYLKGSTLALPVISCKMRSEEHTSELQSRENLVCRLLL